MTRTIGAAIGALLVLFFMSYVAARTVSPVQAEAQTISQR